MAAGSNFESCGLRKNWAVPKKRGTEPVDGVRDESSQSAEDRRRPGDVGGAQRVQRTISLAQWDLVQPFQQERFRDTCGSG